MEKPQAKKRIISGRVTRNQRSRLLALMQQHNSIGKGQFTVRDCRQVHEKVWAAVAAELNAMGGTFKTADQWKKSWIDWKSTVKKLYAEHKAFARRTGNLPASEGPKQLDDLDQSVVDFPLPILC